jgi:glutamate:GABA antiporter
VVVWVIACAAFYVPLGVCVVELSSRYPEEGGPYVWSKRVFGEFAGFMTGWTYWVCNLPYFPALLYFAAANALFVGDGAWRSLAGSPTYFVIAALLGLALAAGLNIVGLDVGRWLHNVGAVAQWVPALVLVAMGGVAVATGRVATELTAASLVPGTRLKDVALWSAFAFSLSGLEAASILSGEIKDVRRSLPRALLVAAPTIAVLYMLTTVSVLLAIPTSQTTDLEGVVQAIAVVSARAGLGWLVPVVAALVVVGCVGQAGAWFAAGGRLPFVAGIDRRLPAAFGRVHPRWGTPHVALATQAVVAAAFVFLGQAGTGVKGAYDILVNMSIISYFIPYVFMFAALIKVQGEPAGAAVVRVPGGRRAALAAGVVGLATTVLSIGLAALPPDDEPNKPLAVAKIVGLTLVLVAGGVVVYGTGPGRTGSRE